MTVSNEAVTVALQAWRATPFGGDALMNALEAAAPFIRAEALEEAADDPTLRLAGHSGVSITRLRARAAEMRQG